MASKLRTFVVRRWGRGSFQCSIHAVAQGLVMLCASPLELNVFVPGVAFRQSAGSTQADPYSSGASFPRSMGGPHVSQPVISRCADSYNSNANRRACDSLPLLGRGAEWPDAAEAPAPPCGRNSRLATPWWRRVGALRPMPARLRTPGPPRA